MPTNAVLSFSVHFSSPLRSSFFCYLQEVPAKYFFIAIFILCGLGARALLCWKIIYEYSSRCIWHVGVNLWLGARELEANFRYENVRKPAQKIGWWSTQHTTMELLISLIRFASLWYLIIGQDNANSELTKYERRLGSSGAVIPERGWRTTPTQKKNWKHYYSLPNCIASLPFLLLKKKINNIII